MSRRSRSKSETKGNLAVYIIIAVAVAAALAVGFVMIRKNSNPYPGIKEINAVTLKENGRSISGNVYLVTGKISENRRLPNDRGVFLSVVQDGKTENAGTVPVHVPPGVAKINLETGLGYIFKVRVSDEGLPVAEDIKAQ